MLLAEGLPLHVGDRVQIVCPESPEICVERVVGTDGTIDLPLVGPLRAASRQARDLAAVISAALIVPGPPPAVEVRWLGSASGEISITGAVTNAINVYAPKGIATERLFAAAGLLPHADRTSVSVGTRVRPGSSVFVPSVTAERRISVLGAVVNPKALPPSEGLTLATAIEAAGGLGAHADPNAIVIDRFGEPMPAQMPADAALRLHPGDVIRVGLLATRHYIVVRGMVVRPGSVEYAPGMTATRALAAAGGLSPSAKTGTLVWQSGSKSFRLSLAFLLQGRIPDPVLGAEDTLIVEAGRR